MSIGHLFARHFYFYQTFLRHLGLQLPHCLSFTYTLTVVTEDHYETVNMTRTNITITMTTTKVHSVTTMLLWP